jgi:hypothetical protein
MTLAYLRKVRSACFVWRSYVVDCLIIGQTASKLFVLAGVFVVRRCPVDHICPAPRGIPQNRPRFHQFFQHWSILLICLKLPPLLPFGNYYSAIDLLTRARLALKLTAVSIIERCCFTFLCRSEGCDYSILHSQNH